MPFASSSISARVIAAFAGILIIVVALGLTALNGLDAVNEKAVLVRDNYLPSVELLSEIRSDLLEMRTKSARLLIHKGGSYLADDVAQYEDMYAQARKGADSYKTFVDKGTEDERLATLFREEALPAFARSTAQMIDAVRAGDIATAERLYGGENLKFYNAAKETITKEIAWNGDRGKEAADAGEAVYHATLWLIAIAIAITIMVSSFLGWSLVRSVSTPVKVMTAVMARLAAQDMTVEIPGAARKDEIGAMAKTVQVFKDGIIEATRLRGEQEAVKAKAEAEKQQAMTRIADEFDAGIGGVVQSVSDEASKMQTSAQSLSATAEEAARQSTAVAAASEQASTNVQTVASATEELSSTIAEISRQVAQSSRIAGAAVTEAEKADRMVGSLAEASRKIGAVIGLITDIADQTNLLALNATIEAARAGEAGKGFAVVASEVKNLANQTAKATEEIGAQIAGVQSATEQAVEAIRIIGKTIGEINHTTTLIAAAVEQQGAATKEIARNVEEAAAGTQEVTANIAGVNRAAGDTGAAASSVLTSAQGLVRQSENLRAVAGRFLRDIKAA